MWTYDEVFSHATCVLFILVLIPTGTLLSHTIASTANRVRWLRHVPRVVWLLGVGTALRLLLASSVASSMASHAWLDKATDLVVDFSLAAMGIEIGTHLAVGLTQQPGTSVSAASGVQAPHISEQLAFFMITFVAVVMIVMSVGVRWLMPAMVPYASLAASIAVERSSPECLSSVKECRAQGPLTSSLLCISALQDIAAISCFVLSSIALGSTSAAEGFGHLAGMTMVTVTAAFVAARLIAPRFRASQGVLALFAVCVGLVTISEFVDVMELLLGAVGAGLLLHRQHKATSSVTPLHSIPAVLESHGLLVSSVLFTWIAFRLNILEFLGLWSTSSTSSFLLSPDIGTVIGLFMVRLGGLFCGSWIGARVSATSAQHGSSFLRNFGSIRWMGLVTQLAIALSLVQRGERAFPQSSPLMRAYGGAILLSLFAGPTMLRWCLRLSGEAGEAETHGVDGSSLSTESVPDLPSTVDVER